MNIIEEYKNSINKIDFFNNLNIDNQIIIINSLSLNETKELLENLTFDKVKKILKEYNYGSKERKKILNNISKNKLDAIYKTSNKEEQARIRVEIESIQADSLDNIQKNEEFIINSSNIILDSMNKIDNAKSNIANSKLQIKETKKELKKTKITLKKVSKEREKLLKKIQRLQLKNPSKIGIFNKLRINKLKELTEKLELKEVTIEDIKEEKNRLKNEIKEERKNIKDEEKFIEEKKQDIKNRKQQISLSVKYINNKKVEIRELNEKEKKIFGRKTYKKISFIREDILATRKKKTINKNVNTEKEKSPKENTTKNIEQTNTKPAIEENKDTKKIVENNNKKEENDIAKQSIENLNDLFQTLITNGLKPLPNMNLNSSSNEELLKNPINNINIQQLVTLMYGLNYAYQLGLQQAKQQELATAREEGRVDEYGNIISLEEYRNRKSNIRKLTPGFINFPTILFILSFLISIASIIMLLTKK